MGTGPLRRLGFARTDYSIHDGAGDEHISLRKVDVTPLQAEHLALSQSGRGCKQNQRPFSDVQVVYQRLYFTGHEDGWRLTALCTLTNEVNRIAVEQLISAGMIEENRHQVSDFCATAFC